MPNFDNYPGTPPLAPYASGTVTVGTTAVLLATVTSPGAVVVQNNSTTAITVYLGGAGVTATGATQGYTLTQNASINVPTLGDAQCQLYAIAASAGALVTYLYPTA
jgi:hypothetical protein